MTPSLLALIDAAADSDPTAHAIKHSRWYSEIEFLEAELEGARTEIRHYLDWLEVMKHRLEHVQQQVRHCETLFRTALGKEGSDGE